MGEDNTSDKDDNGKETGIKALFSTLPDLSNGTPLRTVFKSGREKLNSILGDTSEKRAYAARRWDEIRGTAKAHTAMTFARVGIDYSDAEDFNDFRLMHPQLLISGATLAVALPSMFFGKRILFRNTLAVAAFASIVAYSPEWWKRRHPPPPPPQQQ